MATLDTSYRQELDKHTDLINQRKGLRNQFTQQRDQGVSDLKGKYAYEDRISNLEGLRKAAFDTEKLLKDLPQNVQNRSRGRLITAGQKNRMLASEQNPLARQLGDISSGRDSEQSGLSLIDKLVGDYRTGVEQDYNRTYQTNLDEADATWKRYGTMREDAWNAYNSELDVERQKRAQAIQWAQFNAQRDAERRQRELQQAILAQRQAAAGGGAGGAGGVGGSGMSVRVGSRAADNSLGSQVSRLGRSASSIPISASVAMNSAIYGNNPELNAQRNSTIKSNDFLNDLSMRYGDWANTALGGNAFRGYGNRATIRSAAPVNMRFR